MKPYLYLDGLKQISKEMSGSETVHVGIRPYGFHAGNALALVVYPYLLCLHLEREKKDVRLNFIISINDWEQDALDGPDYRKYPFNIYPKNSSLQFTKDDGECHSSIVEHWEPIIKGNIEGIKKRFSGTTFSFIKNSQLADNTVFQDLLIETIKNPDEQADIYRICSGKEVLKNPIKYAGAICPECKKSSGETLIDSHGVSWKCNECGIKKKGNLRDFQYWWYHKPMLLARIKIFNIDITLSGGDHFSEGDFAIRNAFAYKYFPNLKIPKMLFTPILIGINGEKMSKSRKNISFVDIASLIKIMEKWNGSEFQITEDIIINEIDEKDYSNIF